MDGATKVRMKIRNGYQKSPRLFEANSRAKDLTVVLLPSNKTVEVALTDQSGWQEIAVEQAAGPLEAVELRVKSVFPGKKYDDLCLSDLQLHVTATSTDNPAFEKQRLTKIIEWKKDRVAAAKLFRTQLGQSLPIAPQYAVTRLDAPSEGANNRCPDGGDACRMSEVLSRAARAAAKGKHAAAVATALDLTRTNFATMTAVRVSTRDKRPVPTVDGLCTPNLNVCDEDPCENALPLPITGQIAYLNTDALALVEQSGLPPFSDVLARKPPQCSRWQPTTFAWALRDASSTSPDGGVAPLRALLLVQCGMVNVREGTTEAARPQLLVYGADGRLEVVSGTGAAAVIDWDQGPDGPKLARASITGEFPSGDMRVEAAVAVAHK
jgi:hypothetical protein